MRKTRTGSPSRFDTAPASVAAFSDSVSWDMMFPMSQPSAPLGRRDCSAMNSGRRMGHSTPCVSALRTLLELLGQAPRTVEVLAKETGQSVANVSQHLQVLRGARLVEARKDGFYVTYRLADEQVLSFLRALRTLAETRIEEIGQVTRAFLEERDALEPVDVSVSASGLASTRYELGETRIPRGRATLSPVRGRDGGASLPGAPSSADGATVSSVPEMFAMVRRILSCCRGGCIGRPGRGADQFPVASLIGSSSNSSGRSCPRRMRPRLPRALPDEVRSRPPVERLARSGRGVAESSALP